MLLPEMEPKIAAVLASAIENALGENSSISADISRIERNYGLLEVTFKLVLKAEGYSPRSADRYVTVELNTNVEDDQFKAELRGQFAKALGLDRLAEEFAPRF